ncbi:MAG TPA: FlgD immunoglobulin-like domain containing protein [Candidatus Eisenbacteria bacterium]|nr:FlgD immunoglobulin-like domain containing protein [Candidatus Eisenbacteria bacterium]
MLPRLTALPSILLALAVPGVAQAAWPHDPNNGNVPLCTAAGPQSDVTMIPDGAGGAFVTWHDLRAGNMDIYVQRVSATGAPLWTANGVALCTAAFDQQYPTIVSDGADGAIVTWFDFRNGLDNDIYAQRVNGAGVTQWAANGVALSGAAGDQFYPTIASDGASGAIVTWYDTRNGNNDIFAQRVNASGANQWGVNGKIVCNLPSSAVVPTIISDGAGGAVIAWFDLRNGNWDVFAQRINAASGTGQWTANGVALGSGTGDQRDPRIISDGAGGAIVTWYDSRSGNSDIYAQRVDANGNAQWTPNGVALCTAANEQTIPVLVSDGSGGAVVAWPDARGGANDIYAQRVAANGAVQWTLNGVALCTAVGTQNNPAIASDGAGGAIVTWYDLRSGVAYDIYASRVTGIGTALWSANGSALCTAVGAQQNPALVADAAGGAIVAWQDGRSGNLDIYAQQIERFGYLGDPGSVIASVRDVPNDQGGKVKVSWSASYLDVDPTYGIYEYRLWRSVPTQLLVSGLDRMTTEDPDVAAATGLRLVMPFGATDYAWELVGTQTAAILSSYSLVSSTTSDSVSGSNPRTAFMVEARSGTSLSSPRWFSAPDSGYSVDNIAPAPPQPFTGNYAAGSTSLHWGVSTEADFALYRLYRGSSAGFVPGPSNLVTSSADTGYVDAGTPAFYKLSAVDVHGNESVFALLTPDGTVDVPGSGSLLALRLGIPQPNPARGSTRIAFDLPRAGSVSLAVYDPSGRRVRGLFRGRHQEGTFSLTWNLRNDDGHTIPSGMYFVRLEALGRALTQRMVAMP